MPCLTGHERHHPAAPSSRRSCASPRGRSPADPVTRPRAPARSPLAGGRSWDPRLYQIATLSGLLGYVGARGWTSRSRRRSRWSSCRPRSPPSSRAPGSPAWPLRPAERAHLGALAVPAAAHRVPLLAAAAPWPPSAASSCSGPGQARLQSDQLRHRRHAARQRRGVGVARPVGERRGLRVPARRGRQPRGEPRGAGRRHLGVPGCLRGAPARPRALARRSARPSRCTSSRTARSCCSPSS